MHLWLPVAFMTALLCLPIFGKTPILLECKVFQEEATRAKWRSWLRALPLLLVLLLVLNPEIRVFAIFLDIVGPELLLLLLALELKSGGSLFATDVIRPVYGFLCRFQRAPCFVPTCEIVRRNPVILIYALPLWPIVFASMVMLAMAKVCLTLLV